MSGFERPKKNGERATKDVTDKVQRVANFDGDLGKGCNSHANWSQTVKTLIRPT